MISHPFSTKEPINGRVIPKANRLQLVSRYCNDDFVDVGLSSFCEIDEVAQKYFRKRGFLKQRLPFEEILSFKYVIVVDGNSFASQLPWSLHCRSLVLMVPPAWESIVEGIKAWKHYVPLAPDFSDLREKIEWCRHNDRQCKEISWSATELMRHHYGYEQESVIQQRIIEHYAESFPSR